MNITSDPVNWRDVDIVYRCVCNSPIVLATHMRHLKAQ